MGPGFVAAADRDFLRGHQVGCGGSFRFQPVSEINARLDTHDVLVDVDRVGASGEDVFKQVGDVENQVVVFIHIAVQQDAVARRATKSAYRELHVALLVVALHADHGIVWCDSGGNVLARNILWMKRSVRGEKSLAVEGAGILENKINAFEQIRVYDGHETLPVHNQDLLDEGEPGQAADGVYLGVQHSEKIEQRHLRQH